MKSLLYILFAVLLVVIIGVIGFSIFEGWCFLDSFYMTVITLTTTGFNEVHPLSPAGRVFTTFLLGLGVVIVAFAISKLSSMIIEGEFEQLFGRKKLENSIMKLKKHIIICGYSKTGKAIVKDLSELGSNFVVIEKDEAVCNELRDAGFLYVKGDAKSTDVLEKAGVSRARALVTVIEDAENLFVTLTARSINKDIQIVSTVNDDENRNKFLSVGADKVISTFHVCSLKIVRSILNPAIEDLLEITSGSTNVEFQVAEVSVDCSSGFCGKKLMESNIRAHGVMVVGIRKQDGILHFPPDADMILEKDDILIIIGKSESIDKFCNNH